MHKILSYKRAAFFLLCPFLSFFAAGCQNTSTVQDENSAFRKFTHTLFCQEVSSDTLTLHYTLQKPQTYGIKNPPVTYGSFSSNTAEAMASSENLLHALKQFHPNALDKENQLTYGILEKYFQTNNALAPYLLYQEPVNPTTGIQAQLPVLLCEYQFSNTKDVEIYLELLSKTPEYLQSLSEFEKAKSDAGLFMSHAVAEDVIAQCRSFLEMGDENYLYTTFQERLCHLPDISNAEKESYLSKNKLQVDTYVLPAFQNFADAISALKETGTNDKGLCFFPEGKTYYEALIAHNTGSSRSIKELQSLTKKQITQDISDLQKTAESFSKESAAVASSDITSAAIEEALSDPAAIMNDLQTQCNAAFPEGPNVHHTIKYVPESLESYLSPAFYLIPAIDNSEDNVIYINRKQTMKGMELYTTLAHEGYPGHLYQTTYFADSNPDPVRSIINFGGYTEGWATYTEMMSFYMAPISKTQASLLQKNKSAVLGLYALADMGIHYDGWTLKDACNFFRNYGISNDNVVQDIYELILSDPGNYLRYYIGYLEFLELKRDCIQKDGENFSQKDFHKTILETGPAPFDVLKKQLGLTTRAVFYYCTMTLPLYLFFYNEYFFSHSTDWTNPIFRNILKSCSRSDSAVRIADFRIIYISTWFTNIFFHSCHLFLPYTNYAMIYLLYVCTTSSISRRFHYILMS